MIGIGIPTSQSKIGPIAFSLPFSNAGVRLCSNLRLPMFRARAQGSNIAVMDLFRLGKVWPRRDEA